MEELGSEAQSCFERWVIEWVGEFRSGSDRRSVRMGSGSLNKSTNLAWKDEGIETNFVRSNKTKSKGRSIRCHKQGDAKVMCVGEEQYFSEVTSHQPHIHFIIQTILLVCKSWSRGLCHRGKHCYEESGCTINVCVLPTMILPYLDQI